MRPLVWFRADLRTTDNPALHHACREATRGVVALFVVCPEQWLDHDWGSVKVDFILRTLGELSDELDRLKIPLLTEEIDTFAGCDDVVLDLALEHDCDAVFYNREYEVNEAARDRAVSDALEAAGLEVRAYTDQVILPPGSVRTGKGDFYTVYTPFRKSWIARVREGGVPKPLPAPKKLPQAVAKAGRIPDRVPGFEPWADPDLWPAGETEARKRLRRFLQKKIDDYDETRDFPAVDGTSTLSPYLAAGAISPRQCLHAAYEANGDKLDGRTTGASVWISELIWREFYRHVLVGFPRVSKHRPFKEETSRVRWRRSEKDFEAWCAGVTGFPIVDAAMRQLLEIGWMHNRLRMITAMFLSKQLLLDWRRGERFFMQHLVDGDLASNNGGWQWSASTGTDAAPYFRIFNPTSQSRKYDPDGEFIRRYVPELAELDGDAIHDPSQARGAVEDEIDYPKPIVDHKQARERAIEAFKRIK